MTKNRQICDIDAKREITKTVPKLRTDDFAGMKINADSTSIYVKCRNRPKEELSSVLLYPHIFVFISREKKSY